MYNLHDLSISTFMFDLVNGNLPHILIEYYDIIEHSYSTRQKEGGQLRLPKLRTTQGLLWAVNFGIDYLLMSD